MRYTERLPCAAAARTCSTYPGGTPAILAGLHPCGLIYGRALTSLGPHQPRRGGDAQDDAAALGRVEEGYGYEDAARVMDVAKNLSEMGKKGKQREASPRCNQLSCNATLQGLLGKWLG